ncbi:hypothetical protein GCK72_021342 [Caenorhabditis remanei]|uniref:Uncharacterized protein n=1 Tax=Caenorhabditis remanei TaxID=31234 RepID=A0A6A5GHW5_CAERE|nr:hypothetical protein GCK72_021342 [Caenorhabditis remanei]KAF1754778.1 hypothetical protein GCK72_021342 [Caenorhabditis remanei]
MQPILPNSPFFQLGFALGVTAMAQMRIGQESQMTPNYGSAGFDDGYGGGMQGGGQGDQGGPTTSYMNMLTIVLHFSLLGVDESRERRFFLFNPIHPPSTSSSTSSIFYCF